MCALTEGEPVLDPGFDDRNQVRHEAAFGGVHDEEPAAGVPGEEVHRCSCVRCAYVLEQCGDPFRLFVAFIQVLIELYFELMAQAVETLGQGSPPGTGPGIL